MSPCLLRLVSVMVILTTVTSQCSPDATRCEFWLEVTETLTMIDLTSGAAACPGHGQLHNCNNSTDKLDPTNVISMDGWFKEQRHVVVVNGTIPGPTLQVNFLILQSFKFVHTFKEHHRILRYFMLENDISNPSDRNKDAMLTTIQYSAIL